MNNVDATLNERGQRYGEFAGHANVTQTLKRAMGQHPGWRKLADDQREALEMTAHKIGRILNGDPNYIDSWHDIGGYVRLVEQRLEKEQAKKEADPRQAPFAFTSTDQIQEKASPDRAAEMRAGIDRAIAKHTEPIKACGCPACELEGKLSAMFPDAKIEVLVFDEESGRTD
jgi:hypothetical protein